MVYQTVNPYTNELVKEYPFATDEELQDTITLADKTFHDMLSQPIAERAKILHKVAELFREKSDELSEICTVDMGKLVGSPPVRSSCARSSPIGSPITARIS